ncbi:protein translocase subunit SecD [Acetivibrio sp. MSJd-27]|uniref:protein translocase subunit SecD n=1 Tax=Acetivibrio sp. MSJd-27 TaxID=2841523 RepID=UPI00209FE334|nr:protein translocase subunit SecD [Acetivibrio sp. MSJd-27]
MRAKKYTCVIIALIVAVIVSVAFFGLDFGPLKIKGADEIRFGIDIRGGVEAVYEPKDLDRAPTSEEMEAARAVIENRMDTQNILDRDVTVDKSTGQILVRFPWKSDETDFNPQNAIAELGETARLTFRDPDGNIVVEGKDVKKSTPNVDPQTNQPVVQLEFNTEGAKSFEEATGRLVNQRISIYMDETLLSAPNVQQKISGGSAVITGMESSEAAKELSDKINSGALPFSLVSKNHSTISPTLGTGALNVMLQAGLLAFILICLFMIFYYRLPGFVACIGLLLQLSCQMLLVSIPQFTLTLPGIAGMILSVGMGVDTNVIIAERIKEELNTGKTLAGAIDIGYHRAYSAIVDGNLTTAIVAVILMIFGSGTMLSFGYTLLTGVILNFISGITLSRYMTSSLSQYHILKKPGLYGKRRVADHD